MNTWCLEVGSRGRNFKPKMKFWLFLKVKKPAFHIIMQNTKTRGLKALQAPLQNTIHVSVQAPFHYPNMWLWVSNCTGGETVKQSTYNHWSMPYGLLHSLKIYTTQTPFHYPNSARMECLWNSLHRTIANDQWLLNSLKHIQHIWILTFFLGGDPKWPVIWASRAYLLHTDKSSSSELINHVSCDSSRLCETCQSSVLDWWKSGRTTEKYGRTNETSLYDNV